MALYKAARFENVLPQRLACLDIETAPDGSVLDIGFAYQWPPADEVTYAVYPDWQSFIASLLPHYRAPDPQERRYFSYLYAHNGGGFDWQSLYEMLRESDPDALGEIILSGSSTIGINLHLKSAHGRRIVHLRDSLRMLPAGLDKLGQDFGMGGKLKGASYDDMRAWKASNPSEYYAYLEQDVRMLQNILLRFWESIYNLEGPVGFLPMTLPALALRIFRKYIPKTLLVPHEKHLKRLSDDSYSGGRVECYRPGQYEGAVCSDINSMYPSVMQSEIYPLSYKGYWTWIYRPDALGLWRVNFRQHDTTRPAILLHERGKLAYHGSGVFTTAEINLLLRMGGDIDLVEGYVFTDTGPLFQTFVDRYWQVRREAQQQGQQALAYVAKILLNSLYGKFGQRGKARSIIPYTSGALEKYADPKRYTTYPHFNEGYIILDEYKETPHGFTAIASMVTAYARVKLYEHIEQAGAAYIYCDTDSVMTVATPPWEAGPALGQMKIEREGEGIFIEKKLYWHAGKAKHKGVGKLKPNIDLDDRQAYLRMLAGERIVVIYESFPTTREVLGGKPACRPLQRQRTIGFIEGSKHHAAHIS